MSPGPGAGRSEFGLAPAHQVVEQALEHARGDCVVIVEDASEAEVRFANNTTTTNGLRRDRRVTVVAFCSSGGGVATGMARRSGQVDVDELVEAAEREAAAAEPATDAAPLLPEAVDPDFGAPAAATDLGVLSPVLTALPDAFDRARGGGRVLAGFAEHQVATTYLGTSTGIRRRHSQPTGAVHVVARSADGARSAWAATGTPDFTNVDLAALEASTAQRLAWAERRFDLGAGRYEVILPPAATADLMVTLWEATGGQDALDGRSVFSRPGGGTRVGDALATLPFELWSDPGEPALACAPFLAVGASGPDSSVFDNGLPLGRTNWIEAGRLRRLRFHRAGAARAGVEPAAPADNLVLELPGAVATTDDMVGATRRGLLLTCLWYIREVDPATLLLTGLTRDGVYLVEDGEVVGAVNNFRFNESPVDLLARTTEAGASVRSLGREFGEWVNRTRMPPLRVPDFNMSSVSRAS